MLSLERPSPLPTVYLCSSLLLTVLWGPSCSAEGLALYRLTAGPQKALGPPAKTEHDAVSPSRLRFTDVSASSGITLINVSGEPRNKVAIQESLGSGAAALDYDRDGKLDLFVANGDVFDGTIPRADPRPALYRNEGSFRFTDVTEGAGLNFKAWGHGASAVDFDADGYTDLYVTVWLGPNRFFRNRGNGTFEDISSQWGGTDRGPSAGAAFFDADADGDLDLYVANYIVYDPEKPPNQGNPCKWKGFPTFCGPWGTIPAPDTFYENRDGRLVEATEAFGFASVQPAYGLGIVTGDFDNDADVDLYVANDSVANFLFENQGTGSFREAAMEYGVDRREDGQPQAGMGVDFGDVDNDGRFEFFVTNFASDTNTLYYNFASLQGRTVFGDSTAAMRLAQGSYSMLSWGTRIVDLDLDGWQDIVVVSGHIYPPADEPGLGTSYAQMNQIFRSEGPNEAGRITFKEVQQEVGDAFKKMAVSRGLVSADLDDDGDQDLLVVEMDAAPTLLRNDTAGKGHWIGFALRGAGKNLEAIGARISVEDSDGRVRWRERSGGGSYLSTGDPRLVFGLGSAGHAVRKVTVRWPSGRTTVYESLDADRYWLLHASLPEPAPLFLSDGTLDHRLDDNLTNAGAR